jgi:hypothetical protein
LFDVFSEPMRRAALQRVLATSAPAMTDLLPNTFTSVGPSAVLFAPAWPFADANVTYSIGAVGGAPLTAVTAGVGALVNNTPMQSAAGGAIHAVSFMWTAVLEDALPRFVDSIVAVLTAPSGAQYTFAVRGREVSAVGAGDQHARLTGGARGVGLREQRMMIDVAGSGWGVTLFATPELRAQYLTKKPRDNALGIMAAVLACALLFGWCVCRLWAHDVPALTRACVSPGTSSSTDSAHSA